MLTYTLHTAAIIRYLYTYLSQMPAADPSVVVVLEDLVVVVAVVVPSGPALDGPGRGRRGQRGRGHRQRQQLTERLHATNLMSTRIFLLY